MNNLLLARDGAPNKLASVLSDSNDAFLSAKPLPRDYGITGSTFRRYGNCKRPPSTIYREWVDKQALRIVADGGICDRDTFLTTHDELTKSLSSYWTNQAGRRLSFAERNKIVDLFVKALAFAGEHICESARPYLYQHGNIPLDKFSLLAVRELFFGIVVCPAPSMGHIDDVATYNFLQQQIYALTHAHEIPNLVFDHYAWNQQH